jgi:hypothetical protein
MSDIGGVSGGSVASGAGVSTMRFRCATFDDLVRHPAAHYIPSSQLPERMIEAVGLNIVDTPDDLVVLSDAMMVTNAGIVWQGMWVGDTITCLPGDWRTVPWLPGKYDADTNSIDFPESLLTPTHVVEQPVLPLDTIVGASNFGHFVHDTLPYARIFERARSLFPDLRFHSGGLRFLNQRRLFSAVFGQSIDASIDLRDALLRHVVLARRQSVSGDPWSMPFAGLRHARAAALRTWGLDGIGGTLKVFLHRFQDIDERRAQGLLYGRNFTNIDELLIGMLGAGFIALEPGRAGIEEIAGLLARAETVVSLHGAGLANLLFCRPGTRVFELRSHQGNWNSLEATSVALGQRFIAVPQPVPPPDTEPFLDVDMILKTVAA